ncbi:MAG: hypothetical protein CR988_04065 [Treponema sp.]|nr:MAG: hypothetical protein CR988_04065 [Treponema sp.]
MIKKDVLFLATKIEDVEILKVQSNKVWNVYYALDAITANKMIYNKIYDFILIYSKAKEYGAFNIIKNLKFKRPETLIFILTREKIEDVKKKVSVDFEKILTIPYMFSELFQTINDSLKLSEKSGILYSRLIGSSSIIQNLRRFIKKVALQEFPVMLYGESGCGKDLVANLIHQYSDFREKPFVPVNVNTIPSNLAESTLFGTEKGAFTDAVTKEGIFQQANGGTVFLDEIESMDMNIQAKFLRVLETKQIKKLGSAKSERCNFRLISASNKSLKKAVKKKVFREDLYYRLDVLRCVIPPLRRHKEDILPICKRYLSEHNKVISSSAIDKLTIHSWPGNVRELQNCLARAVCYSGKENEIKPKHIRF